MLVLKLSRINNLKVLISSKAILLKNEECLQIVKLGSNKGPFKFHVLDQILKTHEFNLLKLNHKLILVEKKIVFFRVCM